MGYLFSTAFPVLFHSFPPSLYIPFPSSPSLLPSCAPPSCLSLSLPPSLLPISSLSPLPPLYFLYLSLPPFLSFSFPPIRGTGSDRGRALCSFLPPSFLLLSIFLSLRAPPPLSYPLPSSLFPHLASPRAGLRRRHATASWAYLFRLNKLLSSSSLLPTGGFTLSSVAVLAARHALGAFPARRYASCLPQLARLRADPQRAKLVLANLDSSVSRRCHAGE